MDVTHWRLDQLMLLREKDDELFEIDDEGNWQHMQICMDMPSISVSFYQMRNTYSILPEKD